MATFEGNQNFRVAISILFGIFGYFATKWTIPMSAGLFVSKGVVGKDVLKPKKPIIPESMGVIVGCIYFLCMFLFIPVAFLELVEPEEFHHDKFAQYLGGLLALFSMLFLGFADDILDIRWRIKLWFPLIASIPLLVVYSVTYGKTDVLIPIPLRFLFNGQYIHLGALYYVYIALLAVFSTNAINIVAGANGLEVSQSIIIAISLVLNSYLQMYFNPARTEAMLNTTYFLMPFIGTSFGLLYHNWYPASVFVGDTYCYFAGMVFAVVGTLENISKTVLLFMIPQIFNFLYSCPQLFGFVDCPRHRMPKISKNNKLIEQTRFEFKKVVTTKDKLGRLMIRFLEILHLVDVQRSSSGEWIDCNNLTILNLILSKTGPIREDDLVKTVCAIQVCGSLLAFFIRYGLVHIVYN